MLYKRSKFKEPQAESEIHLCTERATRFEITNK